MRVKKIYFNVTTIVISIIFSGCSNLITHRVDRGISMPVNGALEDKTKYINADTKYPEGNLENLNNNEKINNKYYASADFYNDMQYSISHDYLGRYAKMASFDPQEIEEIVKKEQKYSNAEMMTKMEHPNSEKLPLKENIIIVQQLQKEQKIAKPSYIAQYIDKYKPTTVLKAAQKEINIGTKKYDIDQNMSIKHFNLTDRDEYIKYYSNFDDLSNHANKRVYKETTLEEDF